MGQGHDAEHDALVAVVQWLEEVARDKRRRVKPDEPATMEVMRAGWVCDILGGGLFFVCGEPEAATFLAPRKYKFGRWGFEPCKAGELPFPV